MFSFSTILENVFNKVLPRHLSFGHTHLFTEKSIGVMHEIIDVTSIAEWRFGTDMMDLYRSLMVMLSNNHSTKKVIKYLNDGFAKNIDDLQSIIDRSGFCSEIHCVVKKN